MTLPDLLARSPAQLNAMFSASPAGPIPAGDSIGEAIVFPGSLWSKLIAGLVHGLIWQGKVFTPNPDGDGATLQNKILPIGVHEIVARVYKQASWCDGKECIVLDYSKTSLLARPIRDEIRLVSADDRIYLGKVWWGKKELIGFALRFPS
ncbi:MAG TPA: hypothetical protein VGL42_10565 [Opitutaceae bacterium]|jgi:hypothetical protein